MSKTISAMPHRRVYMVDEWVINEELQPNGPTVPHHAKISTGSSPRLLVGFMVKCNLWDDLES